MSTDRFGHLEPGGFSGAIHLVDTEAKAFLASLTLRRQRTVGLDTESRPSFRKGELFPISLVQIATHRHAFIYRVRPGVPGRSLKRLLEDPGITKIVQGAAEETRELRRDLGIEARGFVDLPTVAKAAGLTELNLRAVAAATLGVRISKAMQRSDWSRPKLTPAQLAYAATDAWACLAAWEKLQGVNLPAPKATRPRDAKTPIRPATDADAQTVADLVRELASSIRETSPATAAAVHRYLRSPGCSVLVAEREGKAVGMVSFSVRPSLYHGAPACMIEELVVGNAAQRSGVGRALLDAALREAERRGCAEICVSTQAANRRALSLYRSAGFADESVLLERHFRRPEPGGGRQRSRRRSGSRTRTDEGRPGARPEPARSAEVESPR